MVIFYFIINYWVEKTWEKIPMDWFLPAFKKYDNACGKQYFPVIPMGSGNIYFPYPSLCIILYIHHTLTVTVRHLPHCFPLSTVPTDHHWTSHQLIPITAVQRHDRLVTYWCHVKHHVLEWCGEMQTLFLWNICYILLILKSRHSFSGITCICQREDFMMIT